MDPLLSPALMWSVAGIVFGGGVAWGTSRTKVSALRKDHEELRADVIAHEAKDDLAFKKLIASTSSIEGKLDILLTNLYQREAK